jgi:hypothetical protein
VALPILGLTEEVETRMNPCLEKISRNVLKRDKPFSFAALKQLV